MKTASCFALIGVFNPGLAFAQESMDVIDPDAGTSKYIGHRFVVQSRVSLDGQDIDTLSLRNMNFTPARNTINSSAVRALFSSQSVFKNEPDNTLGTQRIYMMRDPLTPDYTNSSPAIFADITLVAKHTGTGAGGICTSTNDLTDCDSVFTIDYDGSPSLSGVFLGGVNLLDPTPAGVTVYFQEDTTVPEWSNCVPSAGSSDFLVVNNVTCDFQDFETGVYLPGTTIQLTDSFNDVTYANSGAAIYSSSVIANGRQLTVNPSYNFAYADTITVWGTGEDNAFLNGPVLNRNTGDFIHVWTFKMVNN